MRFIAVVGEEVVILHLSLQMCSGDKTRMEQQHPALDMDYFSVVGNPALLPGGDTHQRAGFEAVTASAIRNGIRDFLHQKQGVNAIFTEGVTALIQLVIVDYAH